LPCVHFGIERESERERVRDSVMLARWIKSLCARL
jgi:hypothetical protein